MAAHLPEQLSVLAELQVLKLRANQLPSAPAVQAMCAACPQLKHVDLGQNRLEGPLDGCIGTLICICMCRASEELLSGVGWGGVWVRFEVAGVGSVHVVFCVF